MIDAVNVLAQSEEGGGILSTILILAIIVAVIVGMWKAFEKANQPGWGALVPIYNIILLLKIAGRPTWWIVLFLIPFVNFVAQILVSISVAKNFGKSTGFGVGLALLPFVFYPLIGFGDAQYNPVDASQHFDPTKAYKQFAGTPNEAG